MRIIITQNDAKKAFEFAVEYAHNPNEMSLRPGWGCRCLLAAVFHNRFGGEIGVGTDYANGEGLSIRLGRRGRRIRESYDEQSNWGKDTPKEEIAGVVDSFVGDYFAIKVRKV